MVGLNLNNGFVVFFKTCTWKFGTFLLNLLNQNKSTTDEKKHERNYTSSY